LENIKDVSDESYNLKVQFEGTQILVKLIFEKINFYGDPSFFKMELYDFVT